MFKLGLYKLTSQSRERVVSNENVSRLRFIIKPPLATARAA